MPDFEPFDIHIPGQRVRDRRIAASDIVISDSQSARARYLRQNPDCMRPPSARADDLECPSSVRWIFPRSSTVRRYAERHIRSDDDLSFDFRGNDADRPTSSITTIVLHATSSGLCRPESILEGDDDDIAARSRIDTIAAHFVVLCDATIVYTHDVQYEINGPGLSVAIQIEFDGRFPNTLEPPEDMSSRPSDAMLRAGRALVAAIKARIPSVGWIHPHGQIQVGARGKVYSCPGPDIWVNVGEHAHATLGLSTQIEATNPVLYRSLRRYPDPGGTIHVRMRNPAYRRDI